MFLLLYRFLPNYCTQSCFKCVNKCDSISHEIIIDPFKQALIQFQTRQLSYSTVKLTPRVKFFPLKTEDYAPYFSAGFLLVSLTHLDLTMLAGNVQSIYHRNQNSSSVWVLQCPVHASQKVVYWNNSWILKGCDSFHHQILKIGLYQV